MTSGYSDSLRDRIALRLRERATAYTGAAFNALWNVAGLIQHDIVAFREKRFYPYASAKTTRDRKSGTSIKRSTSDE